MKIKLLAIASALSIFFCGPLIAEEITAGTTCSDVVRMSGFDKDPITMKVNRVKPDVVNEARGSLISLCESAKNLGANGGTKQMIMSVIAPQMMKLSKEQQYIHSYTAMNGWEIGAMQEAGK